MKQCILFLLTTLLLLGLALSAPGDSSFVVASKESSNDAGNEGSSNNLSPYPIIYEMDITSNISNRFAKTLVVSKVKNSHTSAKEATFTVVLPENAFISEFVMEIGGKSYKAYVKEKEEAQNIYNAAVQRGQSAAQVSVSARDSNKFTVSVNIEAESKAIFLLTYEELLQRKNEQYELVVNIHPGQIVKHLNVKVQINETRPLKFVKTPSLRSGNEISKNEENLDPSSDIKTINSTTAVVKFNPDAEKQKQLAHGLNTKESDGLAGQFIVQYDVERDPHGGEVLLQDGYFVHFFAPKDLEPLSKHVVFVLDTSGSMGGRKIQQLRDAMKSILKEIRNGDMVNIVEFSDKIKVWDIISKTTTTVSYAWNENYEKEPFNKLKELRLPAPTVASNETIEKATSVIEEMHASGGTNIIGGLETGLYLVKVGQEIIGNEIKRQPVIIFLTDGEPNVGESSTEEIVKIVTHLNSEGNNVPIYSLSFGYDGNKGFLRKLSLKNQGFSRHIYEAADASLQLQEFYKQISSPLLSNIKFKYDSDVKEVTKSKFPIYYYGSELVVTGRYEDSDSPFRASADCFARPGPTILTPTIGTPVTSLERLWAYLTVKQVLEERELADNKTALTKKALDLALKYSFVTDVTSLVVVKPNDTTAVGIDEAKPDTSPPNSYRTAFISARRRGPTYSSAHGIRGSGYLNPNYAAQSGSYQHSLNYPVPRLGSYQPLSAMMPMSGSPGLPGRGQFMLSYDAVPERGVPQHSHSIASTANQRQHYGAKGGYPVPVYQNQVSSHLGKYPPPPPSPSGPPVSTTPASNLRTRLVDTLPWLSTVLNPNGTLTIAQGTYELGENSSNTGNTECPKTPFNNTETGTCTLLKDCPLAHSYLTDFQVYQQYFCPVDNKYAGVCCAKGKSH